MKIREHHLARTVRQCFFLQEKNRSHLGMLLCVPPESLLRPEGVRQTVCLQSLEREDEQEGGMKSLLLCKACACCSAHL